MFELFTIYFVKAIIFATPCWIINMCFNLLNPLRKKFTWIQKINIPLDFGIILPDKERLLGGSQALLGLCVVFIAPLFLGSFGPLAENYLKSFCVFTGDTLGSFVKRRLHIPRGHFLVGVDHADYMIVTTLVFLYLNKIELITACIALIITYIFHPLVCIIGYKLKIKDEMF